MKNIFEIPDLKGLKLDEITEIGKSLNRQKMDVLEGYKKVASKVQDAIGFASKAAAIERNKDPEHAKKAQKIGS